MDSLKKTQKRYCSWALIFAIFTAVMFIAADERDVGKGLILGTLFSIINFILMGETLSLRMSGARGKAFLGALGSMLGRYLILAIPIYIGIKFKQFNFAAVVLGIFIVQIVALADQIFNLFSARFRKQD